MESAIVTALIHETKSKLKYALIDIKETEASIAADGEMDSLMAYLSDARKEAEMLTARLEWLRQL